MKNTFYFILLILILSSCNAGKRITYLQDIKENNENIKFANAEKYKMRKGDLIYIKISSFNSKYDKVFDINSSEKQQLSAKNMYFTSYMINENGIITIPIIGDIELENKTIEEGRDIVKKKLSEYLVDFNLVFRFASYRFTIMGEVSNPGVIVAEQNSVDIFQALTMAGDVNYNANREDIILIRKISGKEEIKHIDITKKSILSKKDFYIQPGDIIYVKPLKRTVLRKGIQDYMFFGSSITSLITLIFLISK